jgi:sugar phosphate permease
MVIFMSMVNYVDRASISYSSQFFMHEYGLNSETWGEVLGYFGFGYMIGPLIGGVLADKFGPKKVWITVGVAWSLLEMVTPYAGSISVVVFGTSALLGLAVFRISFGLAEGPTFATANRTLANWCAPKDRGFSASMGLVGVPLGAMVSAPVSVGLLMLVGWKGMFVTLGLIGLAWTVIWSKVFTDFPEDNKHVTKEELAQIRSTKNMLKVEQTLAESMEHKVPWYHFFKNPTLIFNTIGYSGFMYINFVLLTWTPKYLQDVFHFKLSSLWYLGMIPWVGASITVLIGGALSDKIKVKTGSLRIARGLLAVVSYFFTAICFLSIPYVHSAAAVLFLMMIGNAFNYLPNSVHWSTVVDIEPARAGTYGGITHGLTNISSFTGPILTGYLVYTHGYAYMFYAAGIVAVCSMIAMCFVNPGKRTCEVDRPVALSAVGLG